MYRGKGTHWSLVETVLEINSSETVLEMNSNKENRENNIGIVLA